MLKACKQLVQTPAHMHARFAHWCCMFALCECALLSCPVLSCPGKFQVGMYHSLLLPHSLPSQQGSFGFISLLFYLYLFCLSGDFVGTSNKLQGCLSIFSKARGLTFTSPHVLVPSTCRWARLATHRHKEPHKVCCPCSRAHHGRAPTACV